MSTLIGILKKLTPSSSERHLTLRNELQVFLAQKNRRKLTEKELRLIIFGSDEVQDDDNSDDCEGYQGLKALCSPSQQSESLFGQFIKQSGLKRSVKVALTILHKMTIEKHFLRESERKIMQDMWRKFRDSELATLNLGKHVKDWYTRNNGEEAE